MPASLIDVTPPSGEPVSVAEAMRHLRIDQPAAGPHPEEALVAALITAARQHVEETTGRALLTQTREARWDAWADVLTLPVAPVQSVTSVTYVDQVGATQTLAGAAYRIDTASTLARVTPAHGITWPVAQSVTGAIAVRFVAGYGAAGDVPAALKAAMLLLVSHLYENRNAAAERALTEIPLGVAALLSPYRVPWL